MSFDGSARRGDFSGCIQVNSGRTSPGSVRRFRGRLETFMNLEHWGRSISKDRKAALQPSAAFSINFN